MQSFSLVSQFAGLPLNHHLSHLTKKDFEYTEYWIQQSEFLFDEETLEVKFSDSLIFVRQCGKSAGHWKYL